MVDRIPSERGRRHPSPQPIALRLPVIRALLCAVLLAGVAGATGAAHASTASMDAQQIPVGLIPDVSSLARYPASALSLPVGLYGDVEPSSGGHHAALFALGNARAGLLYSPLDPVCPGCGNHSAIGAFLSLPAGALRLGAALRGWEAREGHASSRDSILARDRTWWGTLGAGLALGSHSYIELALSAGQLEQSDYSQRNYDVYPDSLVTVITDECANPASSYGAELRWKSGLGARLTGFGIVGYRHEDLTVERWDYNDGYGGETYDIAATHPRERDRVHAALALRGKGPRGARITAGVSGHYVDDDWTRTASPYERPPQMQRERRFETQLTAFVGLSMALRSWCDLLAGLSGNYRTEHAVQYREDAAENGRQDRSTTWSRIRGGFRLHTKAFYLGAVVNNSISSSNPFAGLSIGYRF